MACLSRFDNGHAQARRPVRPLLDLRPRPDGGEPASHLAGGRRPAGLDHRRRAPRQGRLRCQGPGATTQPRRPAARRHPARVRHRDRVVGVQARPLAPRPDRAARRATRQGRGLLPPPAGLRHLHATAAASANPRACSRSTPPKWSRSSAMSSVPGPARRPDHLARQVRRPSGQRACRRGKYGRSRRSCWDALARTPSCPTTKSNGAPPRLTRIPSPRTSQSTQRSSPPSSG